MLQFHAELCCIDTTLHPSFRSVEARLSELVSDVEGFIPESTYAAGTNNKLFMNRYSRLNGSAPAVRQTRAIVEVRQTDVSEADRDA